MILLTIVSLFDRSVASYKRFIRRLFKTDEGPVDKKQLDTKISNVPRRRAAPLALTQFDLGSELLPVTKSSTAVTYA
jgi:hypothetical protein